MKNLREKEKRIKTTIKGGQTQLNLHDGRNLSLDEELKREREKNKDSGNTGDAVEGIKAFLEKREPKFE